MDGPMDKVNPDAVDSEVGNIWRQLYKLEKGFDNVPAAKKIATKVGTFNFYLMLGLLLSAGLETFCIYCG